MQLKGKTSSLILWVLLTTASVSISAWMHNLGTHTPTDHETSVIERNLVLVVGDMQQQLKWLAQQPELKLESLPSPVDVRLVFDRQDLLTYQTTLEDKDDEDSLLTSMINFLKVPRQAEVGITYWRDRVILMAVHQKGDVQSVTAVFLSRWLLRLSESLDYQLKLSATKADTPAFGRNTAVLALPAMVGKPVYISARASNPVQPLPYLWWLSILLSAGVCGAIVWFFYYRPIWLRLNKILRQSRRIMQSGDFKGRLDSQGKDEIADVAVQINAILSSLEYCYSLMAKTNLITTELMHKVDSQAGVMPVAPLITEENELKSSLDVVSRLSEAMETGALETFVQPVFAQDRVTITSYEALPRWLDSSLGLVAPTEFISLCEKAGLMDVLTDIMVSNALNALRELRNKSRCDISISVNLSSAQFFSPALFECLSRISEEDRKLLPHLEFEVKELTITHDFDQCVILIEKLKVMGIKFCIDDYGLSRYSLMYLQRIPVDAIKLSAAFTERLTWESRESAFIDGIARFASGLGLRVIVKNIENEAQLDNLSKSLPIEYQGVSLAPPTPLELALAGT
ncbi:EAL domain-containing protein [Ketobacter sp. MCCC 1A13808]|mgnify:CR=1 FL=1|uniref:EAL domain-containing protein n=1 Tax=Ketobacter sp. MCCC 1A13808 TaxID=2602738 RepID=UPI000F1E96DE|nr:EAL domain-containing protein [Ketobacter sp. MCCC 1A13808]MVF14410.1 EAL domain-containing protein [Ketobacter sp. MCCC 1A13808]RLP52800.1 MAG: EAL domain-containing protein [Ketobacter sp.]